MQLAYYCARAGQTEAVARYANRALELNADDEYVHYYAALVALQRGDANAALESLGRSVELGYPPQLVRAAPDFASLRNDNRFRKLVGPADKSPST
jgi:tetratricopeptide (TPR) repeat protein